MATQKLYYTIFGVAPSARLFSTRVEKSTTLSLHKVESAMLLRHKTVQLQFFVSPSVLGR